MVWKVRALQGRPVVVVAGINLSGCPVTGVVIVELDADEVKEHALLHASQMFIWYDC